MGAAPLLVLEPNLRQSMLRGCRQCVPTTGTEPRVRLHVATVGQLDDSTRLGSVEQSFPILDLKRTRLGQPPRRRQAEGSARPTAGYASRERANVPPRGSSGGALVRDDHGPARSFCTVRVTSTADRVISGLRVGLPGCRARTARWDCRQDPPAGSACRQPPQRCRCGNEPLGLGAPVPGRRGRRLQ